MTAGIALIVSPTSGKGQAALDAPGVAARLSAAGIDVVTHMTRSLQHGAELAAQAVSDHRTAVAMGGDGLVSTVAGSVSSEKGRMGLVPAGRGNDFARALKITKKNAVEVIASGYEKAMDLGSAGGKTFTTVAGTGFDSDVIEAADRTRFVKGPLVYPWATVKALRKWKPVDFTVGIDGEVHELRGFNVVVANGGVLGGGMRIAPHARVDDGLFDVVAITEVSRFRFLTQAPKVFSGRHTDNPEVLVWRAARVHIEARPVFRVVADGESAGTTPMDFKVLPAALRMLVPEEHGVS